MRNPSRTIFTLTGLAVAFVGCRGGSGEIAMDDALDITAVEISAPRGQIVIDGAEPGSGVTGQHTLKGAGAQGRASVTLSNEGVLRIDTQCMPVGPCRLDLALSVPETMPIMVDLGSGDVVTTNVAEVDIQVDRGNVSILDGYSATVRVGAGDLQARLLGQASLRAVLASGDVEVAVPPGGWQVTAAAADLTLSGVSLDRLAAGHLDIHAPGGNVLLLGLEELAAR
jgi:hypothetical protein